MKNFEFKSQICTSRSQSEKLLALGLKKETADMRLRWLYCHRDEDYYQPIPNDFATSYDDIPAWSLHRLMEILDSPSIELSCNPYEEIIYNISECVKYGYLNQEYLKQ
jgi:hypothetical protein